jgi:hypothetical protein
VAHFLKVGILVSILDQLILADSHEAAPYFLHTHGLAPSSLILTDLAQCLQLQFELFGNLVKLGLVLSELLTF